MSSSRLLATAIMPPTMSFAPHLGQVENGETCRTTASRPRSCHYVAAAHGPSDGPPLDELSHQIHADTHDACHQEPGEGQGHLEARGGHKHKIADAFVCG